MAATRQLAAILFTDIEGYTALMQADEQKAIAMKDRHREIFQKTHQQYNGRIIRYYGDGTLSIFQSAVDAIKCAAAMQQAFIHWPQIPVRMGLHTGDITIDDEDVFGDGVNLASRIESLGVAGSVLISDKLNDEIHNHPEIKTVATGIYNLKNIERPVEVFAVAGEGLTIPKPNSLKGKTGEKKTSSIDKKTKFSIRTIILATTGLLVLAIGSYFLISGLYKKESKASSGNWLAVLPFRLISSDTSMEWLSDGFTEELTSSIAGISGLKVKSPTTMLQYRNSNKTTRQIAEELNVTNIIGGSLQKEGNNIIINARLINPLTDEILKNFKFRKDASEIKFIYSEVAQQVADVLNATITSEEKKRIQQTDKVDPAIYNLNLKAMLLLKKITPQDDKEALILIEKALEKDSNSAEALIHKATYFLNQSVWTGNIYPAEASKKIFPLLKKAIAIDSNLALAYTTSGYTKLFLEWDFSGAERILTKANRLDPSNDVIITGLIFQNLYSGNFKQAYNWCEKGKAFSPNSWWIDLSLGMTLYFQNKIPEAIQHFKNSISNHGHSLFYEKLGWIYLLNGQTQEAIGILEKLIKQLNIRPNQTLALLSEAYYKTGKNDDARLIVNELENKVARNLHNTAIYLAMTFASIGEKEKAFQFLNKAYELHDVDMVWLKEEPHFKPLHNEPRYQEMLKKVGFE